jgi:phenylalanyl-tRNA synthetase alpha subunit
MNNFFKENDELNDEVEKSKKVKQELLKQRQLLLQQMDELKTFNEKEEKNIRNLQFEIETLKRINQELKQKKAKLRLEHSAITKQNEIESYDINMLKSSAKEKSDPEIKGLHIIATMASILGILIAIYLMVTHKK